MERDGYTHVWDVTAASDTLPSRSSDIRIPQDFPDLDAEPGADPTQSLQRQVTFPALQRAVVRAMHPNFVRKALLGEFEGFATLAERLADPFRNRWIFHGGEPYGAACCSSTTLKLDYI